MDIGSLVGQLLMGEGLGIPKGTNAPQQRQGDPLDSVHKMPQPNQGGGGDLLNIVMKLFAGG
jgi:hypothetical protein